MSLVERSVIHCPYVGGSPIGGFTVAAPGNLLKSYSAYNSQYNLSTKDETREFILLPTCLLFGGFTVFIFSTLQVFHVLDRVKKKH